MHLPPPCPLVSPSLFLSLVFTMSCLPQPNLMVKTDNLFTLTLDQEEIGKTYHSVLFNKK